MGKIVIIGGGVAGMTAGIYTRLGGNECVVVEKNRFTGGNLTGWERQGCTIDNCMHWLTGTRRGTELYEIWSTVGMLGEQVKLCRYKALYTCEDGRHRISMHRRLEQTLNEMLMLSPEDAEESRRLIDTVYRIGKADSKTLAGKAAYAEAFLRYGRLSLAELAARFRHPLLRSLITDYLGGELSALSLIFAYAAFASGNGDLPVGGSREAALRIESRYISLGGTLLFDSEAVGISLDRNRANGVLLKDGRFLRADAVICACDPTVTFGKLLPESFMPREMRTAYSDKKNLPLFSSVHTVFSCNITDEIPKNTTVFPIQPLKIDGREIGRMAVRPFFDDSVNLPENKAVLQTMFFVHEDEAKRWIKLYRDRKRYNEMKIKLGKAVGKRILSRYPSFKGNLKLLDVWTPASYKRYFDGKSGAYLSFAMKPGKALLYRLSPKIRGLENVFLATQWLSSPGGLPTAALFGKRAAKIAEKLPAMKRRYAFRISRPIKEL